MWSRENIPLSFVIYLMDLNIVAVALVFEKTGMIHLQYEIEIYLTRFAIQTFTTLWQNYKSFFSFIRLEKDI